MTTHSSAASVERAPRALIIITAAALLRLVFAALVPVYPDETYYWEWSRRLSAGYFDHPPAIAWLIRVGTSLLAPLGTSAFAVRLGSVVAGWIAALATVAAARRLGGEAAAVRAAVVITVMPLAAAGLILATPDAPLLAAIAVALYGLVRVLESPVGSRESLRWWIVTGIALGAAFCSKYTSIFFPVAVAGAVFLRADLRARLREPGPYVACVIATLLFVPVLVWNARHDWISFTYQISHGLEATTSARSALQTAWRYEGDFFGGQLALASPILFVMMGLAVARSLRRGASGERFMLGVVALVSFGFFVYSATRRRVEPNWPASAYIPAAVLLASMPWGTTLKRWFAGGVAFAGVMSALIYAHAAAPILPMAPAKDPIARAHGWADVALRTEALAKSISGETRSVTWIGGDRYQEASQLAFQSSAHPTTFSVNIAGRPNQYDLWPRFPDVARVGDNLVLLVDNDDGAMHRSVRDLAPHFTDARRGDLVELKRGPAVIGTRRLWALVGWKGGWP